MACGTGKTYTALKIAEDLCGEGKFVLYMVPSLALMGQAIRDWTLDSQTNLRVFAVCSDSHVGKRQKSLTDELEIEIHDLEFAATTNADKLAERVNVPAQDDMTVVFATYQSIHVLEEAQKKHGLSEFALAICDEAHRTTGATHEGTAESNFVKIHSNDNVKSDKRLYMTATPRVYGNAVKSKAKEESIALYSMDNSEWYGETLYARGFSWAVENGLLTDYRVVVLAVDEKKVSREVGGRLSDSQKLKLDDATKIVGCYKALMKQGFEDDFETDPRPMRRGLAFCKDIASSKLFEKEFTRVVNEYIETDEPLPSDSDFETVGCKVQHVDGTYDAKKRLEKLDWLREDSDDNECRILTNARCLSEGIDVPALDGIMFLHPRKSQIDVVQAVGRVMRRSAGKKMGYIILPIGVPPGVTPKEALDDNKRYKVIWDILNALRSHDERIDAEVNSGKFDKQGSKFIEIVAVSDTLPEGAQEIKQILNIGAGVALNPADKLTAATGTIQEGTEQGELYFEEYSKAIMAKIVKMCGRREYWEDWAKDVAKIAKQHETRLRTILAVPATDERNQFDKFFSEIRDDLNDSVSENEAIEMLAQHLITKPVFDALFVDYSFSEQNSVSIALQNVINAISKHNIGKEAESLERFYQSVRRRAKVVQDSDAKQEIIIELYNKFFQQAFPKLVKRLGIVYTPIEIVDFLVHSVDDILKSEFDLSLGSRGVHLLDPFVGTGTFITRLVQSEIISNKELPYKYKNEIHANEIVLLAYYIAAINIEEAFHDRIQGEYEPFRRICFTDTFQLYEQDNDFVSELMEDNSKRRQRQKKDEIQVIVGNPPFSIGQKRQNDNTQNTIYPKLRSLIEGSYAKHSTATSKRTLYDSYIMAIKWASRRIGEKGVIAFVTNAGWIDSNSTDGMRKCLENDFTSIYVINLRGNSRPSAKNKETEGESVFSPGIQTPIALTILVRNPNKPAHAKATIKLFDIGDSRTRIEKLSLLSDKKSVCGIEENEFVTIVPNDYGDWLDQRDATFESLLPAYSNNGNGIFNVNLLGISSNRDPWIYNSSKKTVSNNMRSMVETYNLELNRFTTEYRAVEPTRYNDRNLSDFLLNDPKAISWTRQLKKELLKKSTFEHSEKFLQLCNYRPYTKHWGYYDRTFIESISKMPDVFPLGDDGGHNRVIVANMNYNGTGMFGLMSDRVTDLHFNGDSRCFPLHSYSRKALLTRQSQPVVNNSGLMVSEGITNFGLSVFSEHYGTTRISKEDVFYYVYGIFHCREYLQRFKNNLSKQLPRLPIVSRMEDFRAFSDAGRELSTLHCNYEDVEPFEVRFTKGGNPSVAPESLEAYYRVKKMKFANKEDKSTVIYNGNITITDIPIKAYEYVINRKSALEWVMDRQCVRRDRSSSIVNDSNCYAIETVGDPSYPLKLFQKVITVSLETMRIVGNLPKLDLD